VDEPGAIEAGVLVDKDANAAGRRNAPSDRQSEVCLTGVRGIRNDPAIKSSRRAPPPSRVRLALQPTGSCALMPSDESWNSDPALSDSTLPGLPAPPHPARQRARTPIIAIARFMPHIRIGRRWRSPDCRGPLDGRRT
jgi:hypothetical protein